MSHRKLEGPTSRNKADISSHRLKVSNILILLKIPFLVGVYEIPGVKRNSIYRLQQTMFRLLKYAYGLNRSRDRLRGRTRHQC